MTDRRATTPQEQADFLFDELSAALRHAPEGPADALQALRTADQAFDALHAWLRAGNPLPQPWAWAQEATGPIRALPQASRAARDSHPPSRFPTIPRR